MCFPDFPEGLAPPTLERLVTDDGFERQTFPAEVEQMPVQDAKELAAEACEPAWCSPGPMHLTMLEPHQIQEQMQMQYPMAPMLGEMPGMQLQPVMLMPVFVNIPAMVPMPVMPKPQEPQGRARKPSLKKAHTEPAISKETFTVRNTFIHVDEATDAPAKQRSQSSPPNFLRMRHPRTTVCLRNLPNRTQQIRLEAHLETLGFDNHEALHMPLDRKTGVNKGYAFIKFADEETANDFMACVEGTQIRGSHSSKRLTACFAARQGPAFLVNLPSKTPALTA